MRTSRIKAVLDIWVDQLERCGPAVVLVVNWLEMISNRWEFLRKLRNRGELQNWACAPLVIGLSDLMGIIRLTKLLADIRVFIAKLSLGRTSLMPLCQFESV